MRRVDPVTGEKINKIRRSYEGKVNIKESKGDGKIKSKELRVEGKNRAVNTPGQWIPQLMNIPEDDWRATNVLGKGIKSTANSKAFQDKLLLALQMAPGKLPSSQEQKFRTIIAADQSTPRMSKPKGAPTGVPQKPTVNPHPHSAAPSPYPSL